MDMNNDNLRLNYLADLYIAQELVLLDALLSQIPYSNNKSVDIPLKDIPKGIFLKTSHDWLQRIMEILDRFMKLGIIDNYRGDINVDVEESTLISYREKLFAEQAKRKKSDNSKLFAWFEDNIFNIKTDAEVLRLPFSDEVKKQVSLTLLEILYTHWRDAFYNDQLDKQSRCSVPKIVITNEIEKHGLGKYDTLAFNRAVTNLRKKLKTISKVEKHVYIGYVDTALVFGISQNPY